MRAAVSLSFLCGISLFLTAVVNVNASPLSRRAIPEPIAASTARTYLSELTVADEVNEPAYSRDEFKTWDTINGTCNTRETVLKRDGSNVVVNSACTAVSGSWTSPYDGKTTSNASTFDIDHIVPLKEAWISGARSWTAAQRESFANDLTRPQLLAVDASINRSKGDRDPKEFVPPLESYVCTYIRAYVQVKHFYAMTVDSGEKTAIEGYLSGC
ncbi:uncharacterized protein FOMMEDRAFT_111474 [Fomitiporia mediterranea MF3/22]|uniref:uncharacterized protein n=1 Tax=Fomitiporia mediterranea (strain MF3/22) TaxID=694068 RepID=UPI0004407E30|nr:uncharacterized protein FOMMEDRAFT_111474 [Fomitiporia mediterranea MF3/22]EJD01557.1 hypothetical protein FOMMEDRAFT_111474 [Fomitiporia mediterranea MF3/22]